MRDTTDRGERSGSLARRLLWFAGLWVAGVAVAAMALVALVLRTWLP